MGKVNILLKQGFICVISVNAILGILLLGFTLFGHGALHSHEQEEMTILGLHFLYGFSAVMLFFSIIGGFGLWKEKKWVLIVFVVGMILICLYFIGSAIFALATLSQMDLYMKEQYLRMLPLSNFNQSDLVELHNAQRELHCCGLRSFKDWEGNLPESCMCVTDSANKCVDVSTSDGSSQNVFNNNRTRIYEKPCISVFVQHDLHYHHMILGIMFGFVLLWILSIGLCIAILCQLNRKMDTPKVFFSPEAKAGNYSNLNDAAVDA